jgi:hypothetical protein
MHLVQGYVHGLEVQARYLQGISSHCSRWRRSVGPKEPCSNPLLRPGWSSNHEISGGKVLSGNTKKVKAPPATAFRMAA